MCVYTSTVRASLVTTVRTYVGIAASSIKTSLADLGISKVFIVTGKSGFARQSRLFSDVFGPVDPSSLPHYCISSEPCVEDAVAATNIARAAGCDGVLSVGGGSVIDLGKAIAALITNHGDVYDYLEVVGKGLPIPSLPVPFIAVPTTSGTGSEVTKNAVLKSIAHGVKASIRHESMLPNAAIVDPLLSVTCPATVTAHVGLDTLCQVIEPYVSNAANPITDALTKDGILRAARSLRAVVANGGDLAAREDLAIACVFGGMALGKSLYSTLCTHMCTLGM